MSYNDDENNNNDGGAIGGGVIGGIWFFFIILGIFYGWYCRPKIGAWKFLEYMSNDNLCSQQHGEDKNCCCGWILVIFNIIIPFCLFAWISAYWRLYLCTCCRCETESELEQKRITYEAKRQNQIKQMYGTPKQNSYSNNKEKKYMQNNQAAGVEASDQNNIKIANIQQDFDAYLQTIGNAHQEEIQQLDEKILNLEKAMKIQNESKFNQKQIHQQNPEYSTQITETNISDLNTSFFSNQCFPNTQQQENNLKRRHSKQINNNFTADQIIFSLHEKIEILQQNLDQKNRDLTKKRNQTQIITEIKEELSQKCQNQEKQIENLNSQIKKQKIVNKELEQYIEKCVNQQIENQKNSNFKQNNEEKKKNEYQQKQIKNQNQLKINNNFYEITQEDSLDSKEVLNNQKLNIRLKKSTSNSIRTITKIDSK
ncbi:hypothetical protein PPERSA_12312 [Pseudocohnilembus persalinus]|uniref:Transmembrane protein n=1 Tax=Pseudocohnilembus persalinus TaxID=266149 RepID=A0A0V0R9U0_PSEPJ|nr:hypothetical protein PPERSA_12312 [Pseudocohnilembus persalinus]|eukprot:KRX10984.1 hypothetical protein PPERSA_12312 [Pseudocohnilembus persalinus]